MFTLNVDLKDYRVQRTLLILYNILSSVIITITLYSLVSALITGVIYWLFISITVGR